jgi:hypothetical protein
MYIAVLCSSLIFQRTGWLGGFFLEKIRESKNRLALGKTHRIKEPAGSGYFKKPALSWFFQVLWLLRFFPGQFQGQGFQKTGTALYNRLITEKIQHCLKELPNTSITLITHKELVD